MDYPSSPTPRRYTAPTHKEKGAVQRSVNALLDELAPERTLTRTARLPGALELHRSPNGCVLQAPGNAVSVSWFADESRGNTVSELSIVAWRGTVARRGATIHTKGAQISSELSLHPIHPPEDGFLWRATDGTQYDTHALAAKCLDLLKGQSDEP